MLGAPTCAAARADTRPASQHAKNAKSSSMFESLIPNP